MANPLSRADIGAGTPPIGNILITPAVGVWGPNFIVREANGYRSREEIILQQNATDGMFPEGLVLMTVVVAGQTMYVPFDGVGDASGILYQMRDVTAGDTSAVAIVRDCEVQRAMLVFAGAATDAQKEAAYTSLAAAHVVMR